MLDAFDMRLGTNLHSISFTQLINMNKENKNLNNHMKKYNDLWKYLPSGDRRQKSPSKEISTDRIRAKEDAFRWITGLAAASEKALVVSKHLW